MFQLSKQWKFSPGSQSGFSLCWPLALQGKQCNDFFPQTDLRGFSLYCPFATDGSADELVAALKRLGFPLDGAEGVLHPLPPALVAADARKRMAKSKYLKLFRKEAKPKKAGWLFSISKASSVTTLACQRCQTFYTCWGILQPVPLQLLRQDSERAEAEKGEKGQEGEEKGLDSKA